MTSENWLYLIIGLVIFNYLFSTVLNFMNDKNWGTEIPSSMSDFYTDETIAYILGRISEEIIED